MRTRCVVQQSQESFSLLQTVLESSSLICFTSGDVMKAPEAFADEALARDLGLLDLLMSVPIQGRQGQQPFEEHLK